MFIKWLFADANWISSQTELRRPVASASEVLTDASGTDLSETAP
jgi:hypothetical protein